MRIRGARGRAGALLAGLAVVAHVASGESDRPVWESQPSLWELARFVSFSDLIPAADPQPLGIWGGGTAPNLSTRKLKVSLWGPPERLTLSVNKNDVWDRRRFQEPAITLKTIRDLMQSSRAPERFANYYQSHHAYDSPCPKPVGQIIVGCDDFKEASDPVAVTDVRFGSTTVELRAGNRRARIRYLPMMTRNLIAVRGSFENVDQPVWLRLYRHQDTIEPGKSYSAYGSPDQQIRAGYNYGKDVNNGAIDPPESGTDGRIIWIRQRLPAEKTFPHGFEYVLAALPVETGARITVIDRERDLGTKPNFDIEHRRAFDGDAGHTNLWPNYEKIRDATGSAATATFAGGGTVVELTWLVVVVTSTETDAPVEEAKRRLLGAKETGFDGLVAENEAYFKALYERREDGRIFTPDPETERKRLLTLYRSWTDQDEQMTAPNPTLYEADAMYGYLEQDWAPWHGLPCYNELYFTSPQVLNQGERMDYYYKLVEFWKSAARANAREVFGLPGALIQHGYLPPVKADTYAHTHSTWEFCMEIPAQILKVLWDRFDYGGDDEFLAGSAYPAMRDLAIFYSHYVELGEDGRYHVIPTVSAEYWNWTPKLAKNRDSASALTMVRWLLTRTAEASELLACDPDLRQQWRKIASNLAPYPTFESAEGPIFTDVRDANPLGEEFNFFAGFTLTTLADEINLDSPPEEREMMLRTARLVSGWNKSAVLQLLGAEKGLEPEQLLNSRSGRIHLFPAVPKEAVVGFHRFQARGGFLVSAQYDGGEISHVQVRARRSVTCRIMNPWPGEMPLIMTPGSEHPVGFSLEAGNARCIMFDAEAGVTYNLVRKNAVIQTGSNREFQHPAQGVGLN